jgi:sugar phosphate isomerase/epimerase
MLENLSRREWLAAMAAATASTATAAASADHLAICAFSKHFQWAGIAEMTDVCARLGYDGIDLTVRDGGHVLPARVEEDLPNAVEIIHKAGLTTPMVTSGIIDASSPDAERVIKTLASLGIRIYRWGGFVYDLKRDLPTQIAEFRARVKDLAALNKQYGVCAIYHTHSGEGQLGASFWDLYMLLDGFDANSVAVNYDIAHATVEGGLGGWVHSWRLLLPRIRGVAVKDFAWEKAANGSWQVGWCPLGKGMVDYKRFLPMLKASGFHGPLQLHMEHPELGGANDGQRELTISKDKLIAVMRLDMEALKGMLRQAGIA